MKLQMNADTLQVTYRAEFSECELRLIAVSLRNNYWNFIGSPEEEDACNDMIKKINSMIPPAYVSTDTSKEEEPNYAGIVG